MSSFKVNRPKKDQLSLAVPAGYNFLDMCKNYRWGKHVPFKFNASRETLSYIHDLGTAIARTTTAFNGRRLMVEIESEKKLDPEEKNLLIIQLKRIYALQWNLQPFHQLLSKEKQFEWIAKQKLGWFLRSASFFEDVVKMLLSVNCTPDQEKEMIGRLVSLLGKPIAPKSLHKSFPTPPVVLKAGVHVLRDWVKAGYRAQSVLEAAHRFVKGEFQEAELINASATDVRRRLLTLRGLDRSFLRQTMLFLGKFEDLFPEGMGMTPGGKFVKSLTPLPQIIQETYRRWGQWRGLVAWFDLFASKN